MKGVCKIQRGLSLSYIFTFSALSCHANRMLLMCGTLIMHDMFLGLDQKRSRCRAYLQNLAIIWKNACRNASLRLSFKKLFIYSMDVPLLLSHLFSSGECTYFQCAAQIKINFSQWSMPFLSGIFIAFVIADCCTYTLLSITQLLSLIYLAVTMKLFHHKLISGEKNEFGVGLYFNRFKYTRGSV